MTGHRLGIGSKPLATNFLELKLVVTLAQALFVVVEGNSRCHENGDDGGYDLSLKRRCYYTTRPCHNVASFSRSFQRLTRIESGQTILSKYQHGRCSAYM